MCNSKINPAFAQLIQTGGKFLNTEPSLDSAIKRESAGTARVHVPGSLFARVAQTAGEASGVVPREHKQPDHLEELRPTKQHLGELTSP